MGTVAAMPRLPGRTDAAARRSRHILIVGKVDGWDDLRLRNAALALEDEHTKVTVVVPFSQSAPPLATVGGVQVRGCKVSLPSTARRRGEDPAPGVAPPAVRRLEERDRVVRRARRTIALSRFLGRRAAGSIDAVWRACEGSSGSRGRSSSEPVLRLQERDRAVREARQRLDIAQGIRSFAPLRAQSGSLAVWRTRRTINRSLRPVLRRLSPDAIYVFEVRAIDAVTHVVRRRKRRWRPCVLALDLQRWPSTQISRRVVARALGEAQLVTVEAAWVGDGVRASGAGRVKVVSSAAPPLGPSPRTVRGAIGATDTERVVAVLCVPGREDEAIGLADFVGRSTDYRSVMLRAPSCGEAKVRGAVVSSLTRPHPDLLAAFLRGLDGVIHVGADDAAESSQADLVSALQAEVPLVCVDAARTLHDLGLGGRGVAHAAHPDGRLVTRSLDLLAAAGRPSTHALADHADGPMGWDVQIDAIRAAWSLPVARRADRSRPRLGIGPRNGNGQAWAWAEALRRNSDALDVEVFAAEFDTGALAMRFPADHRIPISSWKSPSWQTWWARYVLRNFSHVMIEQALTCCGWLHGKLYSEELPMLEARGIKVGLVFRGSEIRDPALHASRHRWSPFTNPDDPLTQRLQEFVGLTREPLEGLNGSVFVTTLDLLDHVPRARWLPQVLDLDVWTPGAAALARAVPRVLHAPSQEQMKGSHYVDDVCSRLADEGRIEYIRLRGVPYAEMPALIASADVVIDQLALGSYGVLALQALASERVVIGHVVDAVRDRLHGSLPIVEAAPPDLEHVLRGALDDREALAEPAAAGRQYVRRYHDGSYSAREILNFIGLDQSAVPGALPSTATTSG